MEPAENSAGNSGETKTFGTPFQKGRSGNPGGRPKGLAKAVRDVPQEILAAAEGTDGATLLARFWWGVVGDPKAEMTHRLQASRFLAERGWGKPPEFAPIEEEDPLEMSDQKANEIAVEFGKRLVKLSDRRRPPG